MSGYGSPDDESMHAIIMSENEIERVRIDNAVRALRPSRTDCLECGEQIPPARQQIVPGVQYCVSCAPKFETIIRPKMLDKIL